jgi:hypothetical protein
MRRHPSLPILIIVVFAWLWLMVGCRSAAAPVVPTATPVPAQAIPTSTATFLPPPTVTLYPTATARDGEVVVPQPSVPISATEAPGAPPAPVQSPVNTDIPAPTATSTPIPAPTASPTVSFVNLPAGVSLGGEVYLSDFSAGWPSVNDPTAKIAIKDGQYHFEIGPFDGRFFNTTAVKQGNLYAQVEVTPETCPDKTGYGLMFHFNDANNYYLVTIFCDSSYTAVAKVGGSVIGLSNGKLPGGLDAGQNSVHHLGVLAHGNDYMLSFEGQTISTFTDAQFPQGDVAIYAVSQGSQVLKATFDNLKVWSVQ